MQLPIANIIYYSVFGLLILTALILNSLFLWVVFIKKYLRTPFNILLCGIASTDIIHVGFVIMFELQFYLDENWHFGKVYCQMFAFFYYTPRFIKGLLLITIGLERHPNFDKISNFAAMMVCVIISILSGLSSLPMTLAAEVHHESCNINFYLSTYTSMITLTLVITTYILPVLFLLLSLKSILGNTNESCVNRSNNNVNEGCLMNQSSSNIVTILFILFAVCYFPYSFSKLYYGLEKYHLMFKGFNFGIFFYGLCISTSVTFPLTYFIASESLRQGLKLSRKLSTGAIHSGEDKNSLCLNVLATPIMLASPDIKDYENKKEPVKVENSDKNDTDKKPDSNPIYVHNKLNDITETATTSPCMSENLEKSQNWLQKELENAEKLLKELGMSDNQNSSEEYKVESQFNNKGSSNIRSEVSIENFPRIPSKRYAIVIPNLEKWCDQVNAENLICSENTELETCNPINCNSNVNCEFNILDPTFQL